MTNKLKLSDSIAIEANPKSTRPEVHSITKTLKTIFPNEVWDDGVEQTAARVYRAWMEYSPKSAVDDLPFTFTTFEAEFNQMVVVKDIEFSSLCAHHLFPFYGKAHVAYIPNEFQVGLSKIPRLVEHIAKRPQVQESMTGHIARIMKSRLKCHGVMVVVEARHTCMSCRGIRAHNASMITSDLRGVFLTNSAAREEFMTLIARPSV